MFIIWYVIYSIILVSTLSATPRIINSVHNMINTDLYYLGYTMFVVTSAIIYTAILWVGITGYALRLMCGKLNPILAIIIAISSVFILYNSSDQMIDLFELAYDDDLIFTLDTFDTRDNMANFSNFITIVLLYYVYCMVLIIKNAMYGIFDYFGFTKERINNCENRIKTIARRELKLAWGNYFQKITRKV